MINLDYIRGSRIAGRFEGTTKSRPLVFGALLPPPKNPPPPLLLLLLPPLKTLLAKLPIPLAAPLKKLPMLPGSSHLYLLPERQCPTRTIFSCFRQTLRKIKSAICAICILASVDPEELNGITYELPTLSLEMYSRP